MACSGRYASASDYDTVLCAGVDLTDPVQLAIVELALDIAASDIHSALASVGACNCTLATWATPYLKKLNMLDAALIHNCPCVTVFKIEDKQMWIEWINGQLELIRQGKIDVCQNATGSEYPAFGTAEIGWTEWNEAQILINTQIKNLVP